MNTFKIEICGKTYSLKGDTTPEEFGVLRDLIYKKASEIADKTKTLSHTDSLVLLVLNIAGDYVKERKNQQTVNQTMMDKTRKLKGLIETHF